MFDGVLTVVAALPQLVETHAIPGVAGLEPPVGSTEPKFVIDPADAGAVAVIVNAAVPFAALMARPLFSVAVHARSPPAEFRFVQFTVDTPVPGARLRDVRNGLTIPPSVSMRTLAEGALHPAWWYDLLTTEPLEFASLSRFDGTVAELAGKMFDPSARIADLSWLRSLWDGPLIVKGIMTVADARTAVEAGADAVIVSNHGGRQLDRAPTPLEVLPAVVDAVGDAAEVYVDGGILSGSDVVAAVACGARAALVGRAYLYGLMAGGERGVQRTAEILRAEIAGTLALLGVTRVSDLRREHVRLRTA